MATDDGRRRDRDPEALETEAGRREVFSVPSWNLRGQGAGTQVCLLQTLPTRDSPAVTAPGRFPGCRFALAGVTRVLSNHPDASRGASSPTSLHASFGNFRVACILGLFRRPHWTVPLGGRH